VPADVDEEPRRLRHQEGAGKHQRAGDELASEQETPRDVALDEVESQSTKT
jgi:hypothetical protein